MIQTESLPAFFRILKTRWEDDFELQETIRRIIKREEYIEELVQVFTKYDKAAFVNRMAGDSTTEAPPPDIKKKKRKGK
jgi:hypothetical protein